MRAGRYPEGTLFLVITSHSLCVYALCVYALESLLVKAVRVESRMIDVVLSVVVSALLFLDFFGLAVRAVPLAPPGDRHEVLQRVLVHSRQRQRLDLVNGHHACCCRRHFYSHAGEKKQ